MTIGNTGTGMQGKIKLNDGNFIDDSTMSGDAPEFMVALSRRIDPTCVFQRSNNELQFVNKKFSTDKNQLWKYDDSSVSGDAPDWMTDTNMRIDQRNVVEPEKRSFVNSKSSPSTVTINSLVILSATTSLSKETNLSSEIEAVNRSK